MVAELAAMFSGAASPGARGTSPLSSVSSRANGRATARRCSAGSCGGSTRSGAARQRRRGGATRQLPRASPRARCPPCPPACWCGGARGSGWSVRCPAFDAILTRRRPRSLAPPTGSNRSPCRRPRRLTGKRCDPSARQTRAAGRSPLPATCSTAPVGTPEATAAAAAPLRSFRRGRSRRRRWRRPRTRCGSRSPRPAAPPPTSGTTAHRPSPRSCPTTPATARRHTAAPYACVPGRSTAP
mmetsp:Transcript_38273/g.118296  ORF Transcript_38273/g.118296 Transcript_38273/m.118296 type:complete len:241 (+) Transcript_38273:102-824(+)